MKKEEAERAKKILRILQDNFAVPRLSGIVGDPFEVLVRTIISQSTTETNMVRAYERLSTRLPITPKGLAEAETAEIEDALRVAGLYRNKARVIKEVSSIILKEFRGSLDFVFSLSLDEARENLLGLPGVGPKTADVVLLFCAKKPTLPVDTHVNRVSKRLGLAETKAGYEGVRSALQTLYEPEEYLEVHMLLIALGRKYCKAIKPLCPSCPVNRLCPSARF
jgi:endonuclease-3